MGKSYDAVIDFNSTLPRAMVGDDRFPDMIDAPFYDYIVDHPLYHHPILEIPLKNFHVICVDGKHKEYVAKYYPHIKSVTFRPLPGIRSTSNVPFSKRSKDIVFTGTYYNPLKYRAMIDEKPAKDRELIYAMTEIMLRNVNITPEAALEMLYDGIGREKTASDFATELNRLYLADIYVRGLNRKKVIDTAVENGMEITVCGNEWDTYPNINNKYVSYIEGVRYRDSIEIIADSKVLLNVLPGFRYGIHDRIRTALVNGTYVVSDSNEYLWEHYSDKEMLLFDMNNIENEMCLIKEKLKHICF